MRLILAMLFISLIPWKAHGQQLIFLAALQDSLRETSGLTYLNQRLITHNDSGRKPALYEIDSVSGEIIRTVVISNATNVDWEDICQDGTYLYLGDFGNDGSRTDLKIYRLLISSYLTTDNDTVTADTLQFNYADQTSFMPAQFTTNFDAEALISYNDSLYIFTKNWGNNWTNIYALPKTPGTYQINRVDSINAQGLVTGATYNTLTKTVLLVGYTFNSPFIIEISDFTFNEFSGGTIERYIIPPPPDYSFQLESITFISPDQYYLTAEEFAPLKSALYRLDADNVSGLESMEEDTGLIYPNPASDFIRIKNDDFSTVEIFDLHGVLQKSTYGEQIDISDLGKGMYVVIIKDSKGYKYICQKLVIK